jgi:hypothetical protein
MTALTASTTVTPTDAVRSTVLRPGLEAAVVAAVATTAFAAVTHAAGVSYEIKGAAIPILGFGQLTFMLSVLGIAIAAGVRRWARHPQSTFIRATVALTLLSFVPDLTAQAATSTKVSLMISHVIAALVVVPRLAGRLSD